jgi:exopolysaccharide production protein ExoZ
MLFMFTGSRVGSQMPVNQSQRFLGIQALRIIAAGMVVFTHSTYYASERLDKDLFVWQRGTRGVDIFFVISGFVMVYASQKLFASPNGWKDFAERRILRIVPLYWLVTTLKVLVVFLTAGFALHTKLSPVTAACSYLFLPARNLDGKIEPLVGVGWTLTFEMLFYFLFTIALFLRKNVFQFVGVILAILSIGAYFREPSWPPIAFYLNSIVLEFFLGMLIAKVCINGIYFPRKIVFWLLACGFVLLLVPPPQWNVPKVLISGVPACLIVWSAASLGRLEDFIPRIVLYLGDASYSIYLIHPFVCPLPPTVLNRLHFDYPWLSVVLSVALGLGAGCLLHQFVEIPVTNWLKGYITARNRLVPAAASP